MYIRIYQINKTRDYHSKRVAFMGSEFLEELLGSFAVDPKIYDKVYEGDVNCENLEDVYRMFNTNHPEEYKGRSLSVSDVVEVMDDDTHTRAFYFCDSFGFKEIEFNYQE